VSPDKRRRHRGGVVDSLEAAVTHIERHGSHHTDCIATEDTTAAERFLAASDSAIVLHNVQTQFADGGELGFGAEIGIARPGGRKPAGRSASSTLSESRTPLLRFAADCCSIRHEGENNGDFRRDLNFRRGA
jgi:hypothetical protein